MNPISGLSNSINPPVAPLATHPPPPPGPSGTLNPSTSHLPLSVPIWAPGKEPLPPGLTESDRPFWEQNKKMERYMGMAMENCIAKSMLAGGAGEPICVHYLNHPLFMEV
jgi:hypothetical protein